MHLKTAVQIDKVNHNHLNSKFIKKASPLKYID